jgi:toxin FitB
VTNLVFLDTGPIGLLSHPRRNPDVLAWFFGILNRGSEVVVPEIADYEVRRELIRAKKHSGIARLDNLKKLARYAPLTTTAMLKAAELWAMARMRGMPTADRHALDGDVILAAQALTYEASGRDVIVASDNVAHLNRFVPAQSWETMS